MKIERLQVKASRFRRPTPIQESTSDAGVQSSSTMVDRPPTHQSANTSTSTPSTTAIAAKSKENPYAKPGVGECYMCGRPGRKSNKCPKRRQVNMANYEDEDEVEIKTEPED